MDYLGWELERQRAALAALLLGGGEAGEDAPEGDRRSLAEPETAGGDAAGRAGRYAGYGGDPGDGAPDGREAVRRGRLPAGAAAESAWEEVPAGLRAEGGGALDQGGQVAGGLAVQALWEDGGSPPGGGTDAEAGRTLPSGGYEDRGESGAGDAGERPAGSGGGDAAGGGVRWVPVARRGGGSAPGTPERSLAGGGVPAGLQPEDSARALSRAVQRDARRYDGGFTIY